MHDSLLPSLSAFAEEFRAFAKADAIQPPPRNAVLFYGSSSIRLWETLAENFPELPVVNRGFGGSTLTDCIAAMERLVSPLRPRLIVLYAGDNDLDQGATPERVLALVQEFLVHVRERLGPVPVLVISCKPSPLRFGNIANIRRSNELLSEALTPLEDVHFIDIFSLMLKPDGSVRRELFSADWLHLSREGYELWTAQVRAQLSQLGVLS